MISATYLAESGNFACDPLPRASFAVGSAAGIRAGAGDYPHSAKYLSEDVFKSGLAMEWTSSRDRAAVAAKGTPVPASILVIDDEENFAALLETILTDRGYGVQTALSEDAAIQLVEKRAFDLALVDVKMGQTSGLCVLTQLKQRIPEIKVIMITAYPTPDSYQRSFEKGASAYCTKPLDFPYLLQTIRRVLS